MMGRGIAYVSALGGYRTRLQDPSARALEKARRPRSTPLLEKGVATGKVTRRRRGRRAQPADASRRTLEDAVREADLVIEAVPENIELKIEIFAALDRAAPRARDPRLQHLVALDHRDGRGHDARAARWWACTSSIPCTA